ncbi:uncharacterized protein LOC131632125 [Vicia villosa]|uniref:uncharacterized protein LOC131632125 n=1 Tax=Vicia villosa TaxID=3911 RepID=UPI00273AC5B9|nr:uncharacterized protein LOC131632125 [Vicia villosa]
MSSNKKQIFRISIALSDVTKLKMIKGKLTDKALDKFVDCYGNILELLKVNVQVEAITALVQFYDSQLRCFTFQDIQLAPTLEEFDRILGFSKIKKEAYTGIWKVVKVVDFAKELRIPSTNLAVNYKADGDVQWIKRSFLELQALSYAQKKQWETCRNCLALLMFGVILFHKVIDYVDPAAINVFWTVKVLGADPTPTILANIYYTIHNRCVKGKGMLFCCIHILYSWLTSHLYKENYLAKDLTRREWSQKLRTLSADFVLWYTRKLNIEEVIYKCGDFPNVTIIGMHGYINYNLVLTLRHLGYPMNDKPSEDQIQ